ncbi:MAG: prepilin peptidase [Bacillota bacterium]
MTMTILVSIYLFILGTILTSFYTLVGMRMPKNQSINGRSMCDACDAKIPWYGLIPIIGYLLLGGKCKACDERVSIKYPLYEIFGGLLFVIGYLVLKDNIAEYMIYLLFVSLMIIVSVSDIEYQIVPDKVLMFFLPFIFVLRMLFPLTTWYYSLLGGVFGFLFMLFIAYYGKKRFKQDALGGGDIKLYFLIGLFLEVQLVFLSLFFAAILGIILGKIVMKKVNPIPFVPFIFIGSLLAYFIGDPLLVWYTSLF